MILITGGATGPLGNAVVNRLLERIDTAEVAILARDPARAENLLGRGVSVRSGDYDDRNSLTGAMDAVDRAVLTAGNQPQRRMRQHQQVIDAAVSASVSLFGFTSRLLVDIESSRYQLMRDYFDTEQLIDGDPCSPPFVLAAARAYSMTEVAAALSQAFDKQVGYENLSEDDFVAEAVARGLPDAAAPRTLGFFADMRDGQLTRPAPTFACCSAARRRASPTDYARSLRRRTPAEMNAGARFRTDARRRGARDAMLQTLVFRTQLNTIPSRSSCRDTCFPRATGTSGPLSIALPQHPAALAAPPSAASTSERVVPRPTLAAAVTQNKLTIRVDGEPLHPITTWRRQSAVSPIAAPRERGEPRARL